MTPAGYYIREETMAYVNCLNEEAAGMSSPASGPDELMRLRAEIETINSTGRSDFIKLLKLEKRLLHVVGDEVLRRKAWILRERFRAVVGAAGLKKYLASRPPDPACASRSELEADMECLLDQIHSVYLFNIARERLVGGLKCRLVLIAVAIIVLGATGLISSPGSAWLAWVVVASGVMGALTSILRRLQVVSAVNTLERDPVLELSSLAHGRAGICIALVCGTVFSLLLYCIFASGLLGMGGVLPAFAQREPAAHKGVDLVFFINSVGPASYQDYAKVVVWSFAAGFAERFVPDVLDRLMKRGVMQNKALSNL